MNMRMVIAALGFVVLFHAHASAQIMVVGIDTKFAFDDKGGRVFAEAGRDQVMFFDLKDPARPALIGTLPLINSIVGPPSNIAVTPDQHLALIANSLNTEAVPGGGYKSMPDDRLFVVDLTARPPALVSTVKVGSQPSGIAIDRTGTLALIANRDGKSVTVLSIQGRDVRVTDTVPMGSAITSVAIAPDGKRALAVKTASHSVAVLSIDGSKVTPTRHEMPVGLWPWQVAITPDGRLGLVGNTGNQATSTGNVSPVAVIDLAVEPPRVVDFQTAGDSIEGLAVSANGAYAAATILQGSYDAPKSAWYQRSTGRVVLFGIADGKLTRKGGVDVGAFPEGIAFSTDGRYVYAGNFHSKTISVLRIEADGHLVDTHADITLPGPPASLRVGSQ